MQEPSISASRDSDDATSAGASSAGPRASVGSAKTVGQQLAAAREREGLSVKDTAERLHVVARYVTAIESGEYAVLPGTVFLKGYVRTYARIVGLDEDILSRSLETELQGRDDVRDHSAQPLPRRTAPKNNALGILAGLFALALVALVTFLLVRPDPVTVPSATTDPHDADNSVEGEVAANEEALDSVEDLDQVMVGSAGDSEDFSETDAAESGLEQEILAEDFGSVRRGLYTASDAQPVSTPGTEQVAEPVSSAPAGTEIVQPKPVQSSSARAAQVPAVVVPAVEAGQSAGATGSGVPSDAVVTVVFTGDCWFDIRAANDERTVGLYRAGQSLSFSGPLPMEVIVGAVGATEIMVDGRPLDFSRYRVRNNRVEFSITSQTFR